MQALPASAPLTPVQGQTAFAAPGWEGGRWPWLFCPELHPAPHPIPPGLSPSSLLPLPPPWLSGSFGGGSWSSTASPCLPHCPPPSLLTVVIGVGHDEPGPPCQLWGEAGGE